MKGCKTGKSEYAGVTVQAKPERRLLYTEQLQCISDMIARLFGEEALLEQVSRVKSDQDEFMACQTMTGDVTVFLGLAGTRDSLQTVASMYARENFTLFDEDSYDALCEIINCINGTFATRLSEEEIRVSMYPPVYYLKPEMKAEDGCYKLSLLIRGIRVGILLSVDGEVEIRS